MVINRLASIIPGAPSIPRSSSAIPSPSPHPVAELFDEQRQSGVRLRHASHRQIASAQQHPSCAMMMDLWMIGGWLEYSARCRTLQDFDRAKPAAGDFSLPLQRHLVRRPPGNGPACQEGRHRRLVPQPSLARLGDHRMNAAFPDDWKTANSANPDAVPALFLNRQS